MNRYLFFVMIIPVLCFSDKLYSLNKKAEKLYKQEEYEKALEIYNQALLEIPESGKTAMNKGSVLYKLKRFDEAEETYNQMNTPKGMDAKADMYYNLGNIKFKQAQNAAQKRKIDVSLEKLKEACKNYTEALKIRPGDNEAKWNLEITRKLIDKLKQQKKNQNKDDKEKQDNRENKQKKGEDKKDKENKKQDQDKQKKKEQKDKQKESEKKKENKEKSGQKKGKKEREKKKSKKESSEKKKKEKMKKQKARQMILQYSDETEKLNKPPEKALQGEKPEKDW